MPVSSPFMKRVLLTWSTPFLLLFVCSVGKRNTFCFSVGWWHLDRTGRSICTHCSFWVQFSCLILITWCCEAFVWQICSWWHCWHALQTVVPPFVFLHVAVMSRSNVSDLSFAEISRIATWHKHDGSTYCLYFLVFWCCLEQFITMAIVQAVLAIM